MLEREEIVGVALLGAICGQNSFLYGPPGTAKSLISRRIACAFERPTYFEYLMNRFSTPEDVFGPVSIKELKEDRYTRKTENYLPTAEFAFLDEIWKSSPAILNTLLTLINERTYRNGTVVENAPLKALIAASNETPEPNQGLDALFDRFIIRLLVGPIEASDNFESLLTSAPTEPEVTVPQDIIVKTDEWTSWRTDIQKVQLSKETLTIIGLIRLELAERYSSLNVYVSDRRWQRAAIVIKAAAFFNDRAETNHSDAVLLQHCLWTHADNRDEVMQIVANAIEDAGFVSGVNFADFDQRKDALDKEIHEELYHSRDIYDVKEIGGKKVFEVKACDKQNPQNLTRKLYVPVSKMKLKKDFHPLDDRLQEVTDITANFDGQGSCNLTYDYYYSRYETRPTQSKVRVLYHKGDKKQDVNIRLIADLRRSVEDLRVAFEAALEEVCIQFEGYEQKLASPFVPREKAHMALQGINAQIESIKLRIADCERLDTLCQ